jgi:hypothetical protein
MRQIWQQNQVDVYIDYGTYYLIRIIQKQSPWQKHLLHSFHVFKWQYPDVFYRESGQHISFPIIVRHLEHYVDTFYQPVCDWK